MFLATLGREAAAILLIVLVVALFARARRVASRSPWRRVVMVVVSLFFFAAAAWLALVMPERLPDTPGSPAALVFYLAVYGGAGLFVLMGLPVLLGALFGFGAGRHDRHDVE